MSDDAIKIEVSGNVKGDIAKRIRDIGTAALETDSALDILKASLNQFSAVAAFKAASNDVREFRNEINRATQTQKTFDATISGVTAELNRGGKAVDSYRQKLQQIDNTNIRLTKTTGALSNGVSNLFGLLASGFALGAYAAAQDTLTGVQNQIRTITTGTEQAAALQQTLFDLANRTRSGIEATTNAYVNFYKQLSVIGAGEQEVLRIVETLNKGFIIGGKSAAEAAGSTRQFIQGLQNGALRGEEFNSVMEAFPAEIVAEFAKTLGVTQIELRALAAEGKITADVIREAMTNSAATVDELFARLVPTISGALTVLNNKFIEFTASSASGAGLLANGIILIGDNLNTIIPLVLALAAAWAIVKIVQIATEFQLLAVKAYELAAAFLAANAVTILWVAIIATLVVGLVALLYIIAQLTGQTELFEDAIVGTIKGIQDTVGALFAMGKEAAETTGVTKQLNQTMQNMTKSLGGATSGTKDLTNAANENKSSVRDWSTSVVRDVNAVSDAYRRLTSEAKAALAAANDSNYKKLAAQPGGTSGSFTAAPAAPKIGSPNSSITPIGKPRSSPSTSTLGTPANSNKGSTGSSTSVSITNINQNISTPNADSFGRSRNQIASDTFAALG